MKTYYAITSTSGKSCDIVAITDNKERAENIKKLYNNICTSVYHIEEFYEGGETDEMFFFVCAFQNGRIYAHPQAFCLSEKWIDKIDECCDDDAVEYTTDVFARDKEHAIQKAKDLWEKYKSNKEATDGNL